MIRILFRNKSGSGIVKKNKKGMIRIQPLFLKVGIESYDFEARIRNHQIEKSDFNS